MPTCQKVQTRELKRNHHFVARIPALEGDSKYASNSFWVYGDRIRVIDKVGNYTADHQADPEAVMAYVCKLQTQEAAKLALEEQLAANTQPHWSGTPAELVKLVLALDLDKLREFVDLVPESKLHFRFDQNAAFFAGEFLFLRVTDVVVMDTMQDEEGALAYAEKMIRDVSGTMIDKMLEFCAS